MKTSNSSTERKVLHLMLNNENAIEQCLMHNLTGDDFSTERNRMIFTKIIDVYLAQSIAVGDDLDIIIDVIDYDDVEDRKETILALNKLQKLKLPSGKAVNIKYLATYIKELKDLCIVRKIVRNTQELTRVLNSEDGSAEQLLEVVGNYEEISYNDSSLVRMNPSEALRSTISELVEESDTESAVKFYIEPLDEIAKILRGYLTYIMGAPGVGKSAVLLSLAEKMARNNVKVLYVTMEMSVQDCVKRIIGMRENIPSQRFINPKLLKVSDWEKIGKYLDGDTYNIDNVFWVSKPDLSIPELEQEIIRHVKMYDIDIVMGDYYQLLKIKEDANLPESVEIPRVSNSLKTLSGNLYINPYGKMKKIFMLWLSQVTKEVERRDDKHPYMNDMYYGGAKDARLVVSLYRDEYYNPDETPKPNVMEFGIVKQNNGIMNEWVDAHFDGNTYILRDLTEDEMDEIDSNVEDYNSRTADEEEYEYEEED